MAWNVKDEGGSFQLAPEGMHRAVCIRLIDCGTHYQEMYKKDTHKVLITWELSDELIQDGDNAGKPFTISKMYSLYLSENANLRKDIESWFGKSMDNEKLKTEGFDITCLVGRACMINVTHTDKNGKKRDTVKAITPMAKGMEKPVQVHPSVVFTLAEFDQSVYESLSERMQNFIGDSYEYKELQKAPAAPQGDVPSGEQAAKDFNDFDDDIPF